MVIKSNQPAAEKILSENAEQVLPHMQISSKSKKKSPVQSFRKRLAAEKWVSPCSA